MSPEAQADRMSLIAYIAGLPDDMPVMVFTPQSRAELNACGRYVNAMIGALGRDHPGGKGARETRLRMGQWADRTFGPDGPPLWRTATPSLRGPEAAPERRARALRLLAELGGVGEGVCDTSGLIEDVRTMIGELIGTIDGSGLAPKDAAEANARDAHARTLLLRIGEAVGMGNRVRSAFAAMDQSRAPR